MDLSQVETQTADYTKLLNSSKKMDATMKVVLPTIQGLADFFGLGTWLKSTLKSWDINIPTTSEVQAIIKKILAKAKITNNRQLTKIQNMLGELPPAYSQLAKEAISNARSRLLKQQQQLMDNTTKAEQAEQAADMLAYDVDNASLANVHQKAQQAIDLAHNAAEIYETKVTD